ncbi:MAG: histidine--tRNA ligase [Acidobacteriaceae bacterium]|jgi:histidyl-tRNA synthetase
MPTPSNPLKAVRGTRDLLPPDTALWNRVESIARSVFSRYGFGEIRTPIFEDTSLFARGVGEETDIVSKEMYTWEDRERFNEKSLIDAWLEGVGNTVIQIDREVSIADKRFDLLVKYTSGVIEIVEFKHKKDVSLSAAVNQLKRFITDYAIASGTMAEIAGRLVFPSRKATSHKELISLSPRIEIEEIPGDFFYSSQSLTLRPENTAGVVRAYIEHKLGERGDLQKLFYIGPQFRRERPMRGRYRQFWQIGAEVLGPVTSGSESPLRDAEVLEMLATLLDELGVKNWQLALNSVGSAEDRKRYLTILRDALAPIQHQLCPDNQRRAETNPLRVLDSKDPNDQALIDTLPRIADFLDDSSRAHFDAVLSALAACSVPYVINPRLVRGLDYYTRTTFEFTVPSSGDPASGLGTQNALLGGGRYDGLSEMLGGPRAPGIGFAIGEDRLILTLQAQAGAPGGVPGERSLLAGVARLDSETWETKLDAYIAPLGPERNAAALALARELRRVGLSVEVGDGSFRLKKSFEAADRVARYIVILGEDEARSGILTVKTFASGEQTKIAQADLAQALRT